MRLQNPSLKSAAVNFHFRPTFTTGAGDSRASSLSAFSIRPLLILTSASSSGTDSPRGALSKALTIPETSSGVGKAVLMKCSTTSVSS